MNEPGNCYQTCNQNYNALDPNRLYCKKGCDTDDMNLEACKNEKCMQLCIKDELGEDGNKYGGWTKLFSRAPVNSDKCLSACILGCTNREEDPQDN